MTTDRIHGELTGQLIRMLGGSRVREDAPMDEYTSFRAGGRADLLIEPDGETQLRQALQVLKEADVPYMILGNGSNILVRDGGYRGVIVHMGSAFNYVRQEDNKLTCGSGTRLSVAAKEAAKAGLAGLAFASGIPGSIGGAVFMNAGAYGGEIRNVLTEVRLLPADGSDPVQVSVDQMDMGYRHSRLEDTGEIVTEAVFTLTPADPEEILTEMADLTARRNAKQPVNYPSAGSFFKRPEGYFAGKLIQDAGLKGLTVGGAQVSELHAGFIINRGGATAADILQLMNIVQARVLDQSGVRLEPEVRIIGE